jgi:hypothetical protein
MQIAIVLFDGVVALDAPRRDRRRRTRRRQRTDRDLRRRLGRCASYARSRA